MVTALVARGTRQAQVCTLVAAARSPGFDVVQGEGFRGESLPAELTQGAVAFEQE